MNLRAVAVVLFLGACSKSEGDTPAAPGGVPTRTMAGDGQGAHPMPGMGAGMSMPMHDGGMFDGGMFDGGMDHPMPGHP